MKVGREWLEMRGLERDSMCGQVEWLMKLLLTLTAPLVVATKDAMMIACL